MRRRSHARPARRRRTGILLAPYAYMAEPLRNRIDDAGRPVCPVCGQSIKMTEIVIRADNCLVHFGCRDEARKA